MSSRTSARRLCSFWDDSSTSIAGTDTGSDAAAKQVTSSSERRSVRRFIEPTCRRSIAARGALGALLGALLFERFGRLFLGFFFLVQTLAHGLSLVSPCAPIVTRRRRAAHPPNRALGRDPAGYPWAWAKYKLIRRGGPIWAIVRARSCASRDISTHHSDRLTAFSRPCVRASLASLIWSFFSYDQDLRR